MLNLERPATPLCPACTSSDTATYLLSGGRSDPSITRSFTYLRCDRCGIRFQMVSTGAAASLYADLEETKPLALRSRRRPLSCDEDALRALARLGKGRRILDIGSGDGRFLAAAKRLGFDPLGVEVSRRLAALSRRRSGSTVLVGQLLDLRIPEQTFDFANLDQVLTYVANPRDLMQRVACLLRPGGILRIREYDAESLSARTRGKGSSLYGPTRVNVWTRSAIRALAGAAGFTVTRIIPGTEASLATYLRTERRRNLARDLGNCFRHLGRKIQLGGYPVGADTVFYLERTPKDATA